MNGRNLPAGSDNSSFVQLRTTLKIVAAEPELHLREAEVREISSTKQGSAIHAKTRQCMGGIIEARATTAYVSLMM